LPLRSERADYVLEGSIRRAGDRVRINGQLIDAITGAHRWAERYDRDLKDVFAVQDEVARTIVAIIAAHVNKAEAERTLLKPPAIWQAYDYYLKAADSLATFFVKYEVNLLYATRLALERSIMLDPKYARAHAMLSFARWIGYVNRLDADYHNPSALEEAYQLARAALQLDSHLSQAHAQLGLVMSWKGEHDAALEQFAAASASNPNFSDYRFAVALISAGKPETAVEVLHAHMRLDPFYNPNASAWLGFAYYMLERYEEALPPLRQCISRSPNQRFSRTWLAATYAQMGQLSAARAEAAEALRIDPQYTISRMAMIFKHDADREHYAEGLRKAGLPEK
jgi:adenylate cyclase